MQSRLRSGFCRRRDEELFELVATKTKETYSASDKFCFMENSPRGFRRCDWYLAVRSGDQRPDVKQARHQRPRLTLADMAK